MSLLLVLHVCTRDEHLAHAALKATAKLGPVKGDLLFACESGFDLAHLMDVARPTFNSISRFTYTPWTGDPDWPRPANHAWQQVARHLDSQRDLHSTYTGWLWWEADACPLRAGWYDKLVAVHKAKPRTLFAGHKLPTLDGTPYMNGVGIWPMGCIEALSSCAALYAQQVPFDIAASRCVLQSLKPLNHLLIHEVKRTGGGAGRRFDERTLRDLLANHREAVFYHGCTDGSLHALIAGDPVPEVRVAVTPTGAPMPTLATATPTGRSIFYHSGDLGDIIYSLPTVRELGGGDLTLGPDNRTNMSTREKMTPARAALITPLLEAQPYVHAVAHGPLPPTTRYDLNQMRLLLRTHRLDMQQGMNLARCYLQAFGLALENDQTPWLTVPDPRTVAPVVLARSTRYRDSTFRWDRILSTYRGQCIFVGTPDEHSDFEAAWGPVPHERTTDLLELARIIAGARLFVGNQSLPYAITEALKKPAILEACPSGSNTIFPRRDVTVGVTEDTPLPELDGRPTRRALSNSFTIAGPIDWFTGLGRATCQLIEHASRTHTVWSEPTSVDRRLPLPETVEKVLVKGFGREGRARLRVLVSPLLDVPKRIRPGDVVLTMWESTRLPRSSVVALNQHASHIIVPCAWCATTFSACGVDVPISVVPLGVDTQVYKPSPTPAQRKWPHFGAAGRLAHGGKRKGIEDVIEAFKLAFPNKEPVQLRLKLFDDCYVPTFDDERISAITHTYSDKEMVMLYHNLDCFISLARGEGWGLHVQEALACGTPVIAPAYSGLADIVPTSPLPWTQVPATEGYLGHWCQPDIEMAAAVMCDRTMWVERGNVVDASEYARRVLEVLQ